MSFRLKTILGIALIEAILLFILIQSALNFLYNSNENQLVSHARTTSSLFATMTQDAILSSDIASLNSAVAEIINSPGMVYARVRDGDGRALAKAGDPEVLDREFQEDNHFHDVNDRIYDIKKDVVVHGVVFGRIELGLATGQLDKLYGLARKRVSVIAIMEIFLSAIFSIILGSYLVKGLRRLKEASERISAGELGFQIDVTSKDEIGVTSEAFNRMSKELLQSHNEIRRHNEELTEEMRKRALAEADLRTSEERFREMAEHIQEVFWLFDWTAQRVVYASPAYETIWGRSAADLYKNYSEWGESVHPEDRAYAEESFLQVFESGRSGPREYRIVRPDGAVRWVSDRAFPIRDESGQIVRIAGIAEDITDRKKNEEERRRLEAKMQHAQKLESLGVMAGGVAHDFNNLLMAILGNADLALLNLAPESPGRDHVEKIERAAQRAAELTNQMLAYSGKGRFVVQPIQLGRLVEEMTHLLETVISKKASLLLDLARDMPALEADASQMRQVVMNLITNASEALGAEAGTIRVSSGVVEADRGYLAGCHFGDARPEGRYVYLEVSDTGCGMDEETQHRIFDPFFTTKFTGRGLGLAAVLGIVQGHNGAIKVYSEPERGSTLKVLFPATEAVAEPAKVESETRRPELEGATILVVDDEPGVLDVATEMLERVGFRVLTAADGRQGVETFRQHHDEIALVILDMTMPHMDGKEAFQELQRIRSGVRVILSSGYNEQDATNRFAGKGLAGFLQKPYRTTKLLEKIYEVLERS